MTLTPFQRRIDSRGRLNIPQSYWDVIGAKDYDLVYIIDSVDTDGKPVLKLRKTLVAPPPPPPPPTPTCQPNAHYDTALAKCVCNSGYIADLSGNCIVLPPPPPPPTNILLEDTFDTPYNFTTDGQVSPDGKWKMKYLSGGKTGVANGVLTTYPATATVSTTTYSTLVMSTKTFTDFQLDLDIITNKQLRTPTPKSWETAWVFFRYTDEAPRSVHHYYFLLKTDGYEFGKKDNAPGDTSPEKQIFIKTGPLPKAVVGTKYHITVRAIGSKFTISVNGVVVVDMVDPDIHDPTKMSQGLMGLYEEDCNASFDSVKVVTPL